MRATLTIRDEEANGFLYPEMSPEHTEGHVDCPACEMARRVLVEPAKFGALRFKMAAPIWLDEHSISIAPRTRNDYKRYIRNLTRFFGDLPLRDIHIGHIQEYQRERGKRVVVQTIEGKRKRIGGAGASVINHEVNTIAQILARAGLWTEIQKFYRPLALPKAKVGKALSDRDYERLFVTAGSRKRWLVALCCMLISANTTAGPSEILNLHLGDVDFDNRVLTIREGTKNEYRVRPIPLNDAALWAIRKLLVRARRLGASDPDHYLLPRRAARGRGWDLDLPMRSYKRAWGEIRKAADLTKIRLYDLRHHAITRLLENPAISERTITEIAGHVSQAMLKRYSHIRMGPKIDALKSLENMTPIVSPGLDFPITGEISPIKKKPEIAS